MASDNTSIEKSNRRQRIIAVVVAVVAVIAVIALVTVLTITATSQQGAGPANSANSAGDLTNKVSLVSAHGSAEPKVKISAPVHVSRAIAYRRLKEGSGPSVKNGQRMCLGIAAYDAKTGEKTTSTWSTHQPDCSTVHGKEQQAIKPMFNGAKVGTIWALSTPAEKGSATTSANAQGASVWVMELTHAVTDLKKATGTVVRNLPKNLPTVTRAANGRPSISMNGYKGSSKLVSQNLIDGRGARVKSTSTLSVQYTGWLLSGKQFDSSWKRGTPSSFALSNVVKGWQQGLVGKRVGSQVLLVVPPSLGYGNKAQGSIPANSTLVFVIDILAAY